LSGIDRPVIFVEANAPPIIFIVANNFVTDITVSYRFGICDITKSFSGLSVPLFSKSVSLPQNLSGGLLSFFDEPPPPNAMFTFNSGSPEEPGFTEVGGIVSELGPAAGTVTFWNIEGCDSVAAPGSGISAYWYANRFYR
jgi:hypothetical protein